MDDSFIIFAFGFAAAGVIAAISLPIFWKVAVRFAKRNIIATSPINAKEVSAVQDLLRAKFAILIRQLENRIQDLQQQASQYWFELESARNRITELVNSRKSGEDKVDQIRESGTQHQDLKSDSAPVAAEKIEENTNPQFIELEKLLEVRQTEVSRLNDALVDEKTKQQELDLKLADLTRQLKESEEIRDVLETQVREAESKMTSIDQVADGAAEQPVQSDNELTEAKRDIQSLNEKLAQAERDLENAQIELVELKSKLELTRIHSVTDTDPESIPVNLKDLVRELTKTKADRDQLKVVNAAQEARIRAYSGQDVDENSLMHTRERLDMFAAQFAAVAALLEGDDSEVLKLLKQDSPNHNGLESTLADKISTLLEKQGILQQSSNETGDNENSNHAKTLPKKRLF